MRWVRWRLCSPLHPTAKGGIEPSQGFSNWPGGLHDRRGGPAIVNGRSAHQELLLVVESEKQHRPRVLGGSFGLAGTILDPRSSRWRENAARGIGVFFAGKT